MMNAMSATSSVTLAVLCALMMGFAIQRGTTCIVAAVNQIVNERRFSRLLALGAAAMLVLGGLLLAHALGLVPPMPPNYAVTHATVFGGLLLGLGASFNGACALGTIARIGAGQWSYIATPIGFYAGCRVGAQGLEAATRRLVHASPVLHAPASAALLLATLIAWLAVYSLNGFGASSAHEPDRHTQRDDGTSRASWTPHAATAAIGVTFVLLFMIDGAWSYTDTLADAARGHTGGVASRMLLLGALLLGAMSSGITRATKGGGYRRAPVTLVRLARCLGGGALMGWASLMIPGGNDTLVLIAMPLLRPYAWVAFVAMCIATGTASVASRRLAARRQRFFRGAV